jgi:di/tricarboxylate transporter
MTVEIALVFAVVAAALYLFASERLPPDVTALLVLVTVMTIPLLFHSAWLLDRGVDLQASFPTVREGLSGFSSPATITVLCMLILSAGIQRAGLVHRAGQKLFPLMGSSELRQVLLVALLLGPISAFINNTAAVAVAIPLLVSMARRAGSQASRLLLPASFFGMLGGTLTLIGTSTNILTSTILAGEPGFGREIGMFEFTHLGLIVLATGCIYFVTAGRWLMPAKDAMRLVDDEQEAFVIELGVPDDSPLVGATLGASAFELETGVRLVKLVRGRQVRIERAASTELEAGDVIMVRATPRQILDLIGAGAVRVLSEFAETKRVRGDGRLVRVLLRNRNLFNGSRAGAVDFWTRYQARLIGLDTATVASRRLAREPLHVGEVALLQVSSTALARLRRHPDVVVLEEHDDDFDARGMWVAGGIVVGVVLAATLTPLPIVVTAIAGVVAMTVTGCLQKDDLYSGVAWDVIFLLAGIIPLGIAMTKSGAADWLAGELAARAGDWHPVFVLMTLYAVTTLLTELVSNNASVVILVPVAISIAGSLGLEPFPLVLAVMFAASTSFLTPIGYQTNTMIFGTGVFRFTDFVKVGAPLNAILMVVTCVAIYLLWPL